ncbi:unnamed protein product [Euphydryas editha]|uniref:Regulatory protein zeste n=1 Tax=Euphydryas editha TaxID=104508 RepID=A0AAU9UT83_EUPED|nr:unnamed protein product [Euphydryas editha]
MSKRKRDPTFTTSEKETLLELITTHFSTVESKKTDAVTMKRKTEEWCKIATEFNAISGTGGGPPKKDIEDPIINRVLELIQARLSGFVNCFDSDGTQILDIDICESQSLVKLNEPILTTSSDDWSQYTPSMLKSSMRVSSFDEITKMAQTPSLAALAATTTSRRRPAFKDKSGTPDLIKEKIETLLKASVHAIEEQEIKMKILRIQEEKEKEILNQELIKTKQEKIKLNILEMQFQNLD